MSQSNHGGNNLAARRADRHLLDKAAVDFDLVEGKRNQMPEARIARPEVVDRELAAHGFDFLGNGQRLVLVFQNGGLRYLHDQPVQRQTGVLGGFADLRGKTAITQLDRRDIHGKREVARDHGGGTKRLAENLARQDADDPQLFRQLDKVTRQDETETRMPPAREHLKAGQAHRSEVDERLETGNDCVAFDGVPYFPRVDEHAGDGTVPKWRSESPKWRHKSNFARSAP